MIIRQRRNATNTEAEDMKKLYVKQKKKVQGLTRRNTYACGKKREIWANKDNGRKMWKYTNNFKGWKEKEEVLRIYNDDEGRVLEKKELRYEIVNFWSIIYRQQEKKIMHGIGKNKEFKW